MNCFAVEPWQEKTSEAMYRQLKIEEKLQEFTDKYIDKDLQLKIGDVSLVINIFLQRKIIWKKTFP